MADDDVPEVETDEFPDQEADLGPPLPGRTIPMPWPPPRLSVSGLYQAPRRPFPTPSAPREGDPPALPLRRGGGEQLRLDVDRYWPQMAASGTVGGSLTTRTHWVASLRAAGDHTWQGRIWYKDGAASLLPYTKVAIRVSGGFPASSLTATARFTGGGGVPVAITYDFRSPYFHPADFEFDYAEGETPVTSIETCAHPNHPASLPCETLTIRRVYQRTGLNVTMSTGGPVPLAGAGPGAQWSDSEMHDAMQVYWSHFVNAPQWAIWVFYAALHETGTSLGGIMFDDIGPNHRQGTSIFLDSFIADAPAGDANPAAWVARMRFWTAVHEMGHAFNLAHSWQKALDTPWIALADEPEARSFMNYPYNVVGGETAFFADFQFRFSDGELLFLRHAPERFVQPGNADWFDHHGFEQAAVSLAPDLGLVVRVAREPALFEFLEPVSVELKLTNTSSKPRLVDEKLLSKAGALTVVIKRDGRPARQFAPFAQYCYQPALKVLLPGESLYESLCLSAGLNGWDVAEPGWYTLQVALHLEDQDLVAAPLRVRIAPPLGHDEELLAQDFCSEEVGRVLAFHGSEALSQAADVLREVRARLSSRRVALHASLALGDSLTRDSKLLVADAQAPKGLKVGTVPAQPEEARKLLDAALTSEAAAAVQSLGHISFKRRTDRYSDWLAEQGDPEKAAAVQSLLLDTLAAREVRGRRVLGSVLEDVKERRGSYAAKRAKGTK